MCSLNTKATSENQCLSRKLYKCLINHAVLSMHSNPSQYKQFSCDSSIYLNSYCHQRTVERDKHRFSISLSLSESVYNVLMSRSQNAGQLCIGMRGGGRGLYLVHSEEYFVGNHKGTNIYQHTCFCHYMVSFILR